MTVRPDAPENCGKRMWSKAKEETGWGEGAPEGMRQGQIASLMALASGQQKEQWSTAQVGRGALGMFLTWISVKRCWREF